MRIRKGKENSRHINSRKRAIKRLIKFCQATSAFGSQIEHPCFSTLEEVEVPYHYSLASSLLSDCFWKYELFKIRQFSKIQKLGQSSKTTPWVVLVSQPCKSPHNQHCSSIQVLIPPNTVLYASDLRRQIICCFEWYGLFKYLTKRWKLNVMRLRLQVISQGNESHYFTLITHISKK